MLVNKLFISVLVVLPLSVYAQTNDGIQFSNYPVKVSGGPFQNKLNLTAEQEKLSNKWKKTMQQELIKPVNFSGHYRMYISKGGVFPKECGNDGWICGWILDKINGDIVSELPLFNGSVKYYSTIDNGTPSPDKFDITFYSDSTMLLVYGENKPIVGHGKNKCANVLYSFSGNVFKKILSSKCTVDHGDDSDYK